MSQPESEPLKEVKPSMAVPATAELDPWTSFPAMEYNFIEDDFAHENKFGLKVNLEHARGGIEV